eukprot:541363_1
MSPFIYTFLILIVGWIYHQYTKYQNKSEISNNSDKNEPVMQYPSKNDYHYHSHVERVLFTSQQIENKVKELSKQISKDYEGKPLVLVGLMRGCYHFFSDISRHLTIPHEIDIIGVTTYEGNKSSHKVRLYHELDINIKDKHILVIEDLVDTAFTLKWLVNDYFTKEKTGYKTLNICCLLNKVEAKKVENYETMVKPYVTYIGFDVENVFVVGYGMDYNQHYRSLPYIGVLKPEIYKTKWEEIESEMHDREN